VENLEVIGSLHGYIIQVLKKTFWCRFENPEGDEEAEYCIDDYPNNKADIILGYPVTLVSSRHRNSHEIKIDLQFDKVPVWTQEEIDAARKKAEEMRRVFTEAEKAQ
jgi:hypothetical protein